MGQLNKREARRLHQEVQNLNLCLSDVRNNSFLYNTGKQPAGSALMLCLSLRKTPVAALRMLKCEFQWPELNSLGFWMNRLVPAGINKALTSESQIR